MGLVAPAFNGAVDSERACEVAARGHNAATVKYRVEHDGCIERGDFRWVLLVGLFIGGQRRSWPKQSPGSGAAPACDGAVGPQAAGVGEAGGKFLELTAGRIGLVLPVHAPAGDGAGGAESARVVPAGRDRAETAIRRFALTVGVVAPACDGLVGSETAGVVVAGCDRGETPVWGIGLTVVAASPACDDTVAA